MTKQIMLVTGANSGMGLATAVALGHTGATVVMLCRRKSAGEAALKEAFKQAPQGDFRLMIADLADLESLAFFVEAFKKEYAHLDVLINNAGVITPKRQETKQGFELQLGVNHIGHFYLTMGLLDLVQASDAGRIVVVSSGAHRWGKIHWKDMQLKQHYRTFKAYGQSKLANIYFAFHLSKLLKKTSVTVNCLHPGAVATQMGVNRDNGFGKGVVKCLKPFFQTPQAGAKTAVYLATSSQVSGMTGHYFINEKPAQASKRAYDVNVAKQLWTWTQTAIDPWYQNNSVD